MSTHQEALDLFDTVRGKYIIGQALYIAIKELEKVQKPYQETSNIQDMKLLQTIFFPYDLVVETSRRLHEQEQDPTGTVRNSDS